MNKNHYLIPLLLACAATSVLAYGSSQGATASYYVTGSVIKLREQPETSAKVANRVYIGDAVQVQEQRGDWVKVALPISQQDKDMFREFWAKHRGGWMLRKFIATGKPNLEQLLARFDQTPSEDLDQRHHWAERAVILQPLNLDAWRRLASVLEAQGNSEALAAARAEVAYIQNAQDELDETGAKTVLLVKANGELIPLARVQNNKIVGAFKTEQQACAFVAQAFRRGKAYHHHDHRGRPIGRLRVNGRVRPLRPTLGDCEGEITGYADGQASLQPGFAVNFRAKQATCLSQTATPDDIKAAADAHALQALQQQYDKRAYEWVQNKEAQLEYAGGYAADLNHDGLVDYIANYTFVGPLDAGGGYPTLAFALLGMKGGAWRVVPIDTHADYVEDLHMDLDGDGVDELVLTTGAGIGEGYSVASYNGRKWVATAAVYYFECI